VYLQRALPSGSHPIRIGVLLAERLQVVGVRLTAAQRATRYLGGNRVLLYGFIYIWLGLGLGLGVRVMEL